MYYRLLLAAGISSYLPISMSTLNIARMHTEGVACTALKAHIPKTLVTAIGQLGVNACSLAGAEGCGWV